MGINKSIDIEKKMDKSGKKNKLCKIDNYN